MKTYAKILSLIMSLIFVSASLYTAEPVVVGYFAEWAVYGRNYHVSDFPADKLTHLNYAFAKILKIPMIQIP